MRTHIILLSGALFCSAQLYAQTQQKVTIQQATVFLKGAELTSEAKVNLRQGENEILFTNVAGNIDQQSISVSTDGGAIVESATFQNNYIGPKDLTPKIKILLDSISILSHEKTRAQNRINALYEEINIIDANKNVAGQNTGLNVAELQKMLALVDTKLDALYNERDDMTVKMQNFDIRATYLTQQLNEEQSKDVQPGGQILVKFHSDEAANPDVMITYVVPNAGWSPIYDVRVEKLGDPVKLFYKANIYQNTGVSWSNVHLLLSTGNPTEGAIAPQLDPVYLSFYTPPAPVAAPADREYRVQAYKVPLIEKDEQNSNVMAAPSGISDHVTVDNAGINTSFNIDLPYSIPADGKDHLVAIKDYSLPATYSYYVVPKVDKDAFLQANVTNWEELNLLPGPTNIFYEGSYVAQGNIDPRNVKDTMSFALGRDKKIIIQRDQDQDLRSVKTIGSNVRKTYGYTISVRNTRKQSIDLVLLDQIPVSNDNNIVIEDTQTDGADYNTTTGEVKWHLQMNANETKKVKLGYTIKYPKDKIVNNLGN